MLHMLMLKDNLGMASRSLQKCFITLKIQILEHLVDERTLFALMIESMMQSKIFEAQLNVDYTIVSNINVSSSSALFRKKL